MRLLYFLIVLASLEATPQSIASETTGKQSYSADEARRFAAMGVSRGTTLFLKRFLPTLPPAERAIVKSIVFDDPAALSTSGDIPYAYVDRKDKSRHVHVSAAFGAVILQLGVAVTLQQANPNYLFTDYTRYVGSVFHRSWELERKGLAPERASTALDFFNLTVADWDKLMTEREGYFQDTLMGTTAMTQDFVLAHEIGHHVLGHVFEKPKDLETSRKQERAADEWAIEALVRSGELPFGGVVFGLLMVSSRGNDIVFEHLETHPAEFRRLDYIFEALVKNIHRVPKTSFPPGMDINAFEAEMRTLQVQLHAEFEKSVHEEPVDHVHTDDCETSPDDSDD